LAPVPGPNGRLVSGITQRRTGISCFQRLNGSGICCPAILAPAPFWTESPHGGAVL